jgi:hypothetical protein
MPLTAVQCRNARYHPDGKGNKPSDGGGLYLHLDASAWKILASAYRFQGKQKTLAIGVYPAVSLLEGRKRRDGAREKLALGIDPGEARKT